MNFRIVPDHILPEVLHVLPVRHPDARGWFSETYNEAALEKAGITVRFVQDNQSMSAVAGTVRGLHFQRPPHAQAKLVRCIRGRILDVAVDLRRGSPRYGLYTSHVISADEGQQLFVPVGFAHGFCTLEDKCEIAYKVSNYYAPGSEGGVAFNDPDIAVEWPFEAQDLVLSDKDRQLPALAELPEIFSIETSRLAD